MRFPSILGIVRFYRFGTSVYFGESAYFLLDPGETLRQVKFAML